MGKLTLSTYIYNKIYFNLANDKTKRFVGLSG